jgi:DNA-binding NarL/FixJ family response regulator
MEAQLMRSSGVDLAQRRNRNFPEYQLSQRELAVLRLLTEGLSDKEIASRLEISSSTASKHVEAVRLKLGTRSRTEAAVRAIREGLVT